MALAISISNPILEDVKIYLRRAGLKMSRIVPVTLAPEPSLTGVKDGTHALHLAQSVSHKVRARTLEEREGALHLFASAPNAFLFFLGQLSRGFGRIQLYEHELESTTVAAYTPSIQLPPPKT